MTTRVPGWRSALVAVVLVLPAVLSGGTAAADEGAGAGGRAGVLWTELVGEGETAFTVSELRSSLNPALLREGLQDPRQVRPGLRVNRLSVSTYQDDVRATHIVGEVVNRSRVNRELLQINATIRYRGAPPEVIPVPTCRWVVPGGERTPFEVQFFPSRPVTGIDLQVVAIDTQKNRSRGIVFVPPQEPFLDPITGALYLGGEVRNLSNINYWFPSVCGSLYAPNGRVVRTTVVGQPMYTQQLPPRQKNLFNIFFQLAPPDIQQRRYRWQLWAEGCVNLDITDSVCPLG